MRRPNQKSGLIAAALLVYAALLFARTANATVYSEWQPRVTLGGGYDDNILLDGAGGDSYGQVMPGLKLYLFGDHGMRTTVDCSVGLSRLMHPEQYQAAGGDLVLNQMCMGFYRSRLSTRSALKFDVRTQYAQDPFSIANQGLLMRAGQRNVFTTRANSEYSYRASEYGTVLAGIDEYSLFFTKGDAGNGFMVTPHVAYERRISPEDSVSAGLRQTGFFTMTANPGTWAGNTTGLETAALASYKHKFSPYLELAVQAGPALLATPARTNALPIGRLDLESATPTGALHLTLLHDLVLGPTRGGPLLGDVAETGIEGNLTEALIARLHAGIYRNAVVGVAADNVIGYGAGAGLDVRLGRAWLVGASVGREARLSGTAIDHQVDRNLVQMRLTWETPRTW